jgi:hypothetical protein
MELNFRKNIWETPADQRRGGLSSFVYRNDCLDQLEK